MKTRFSSTRAAAGVMILVLTAACQSETAVTPSMVAAGVDESNGLASIPVGNVCGGLGKGVTCLTDGTAITISPAGINVRGPKGTYSLDIDAASVRADIVSGDFFNPRRVVLTATGARFTAHSMTEREAINFTYGSGAARDLSFTISASTGRNNYLSVSVPGGRIPFTMGPGGTHFGGDEWDLRSRFGGDEWDIRIANGAMSITSADDWESPITADDSWDAVKGMPKADVALQFASGNLTATTGLVNVISAAPFAASIQLGSQTLSALTICGAKLCDPATASILLAIPGPSGIASTLTLPNTSFRQLRER